MHLLRVMCLAFITAVVVACGTQPAASVGPVGRAPAARGAPVGEPSVTPAASARAEDVEDAEAELPPEPPVPDGLTAVERAFEERRLGHLAEARAILDAAKLDVGSTDTAPPMLRPRGGIAGMMFAGRGTTGTAFFEATTGEPIGVVSDEAFSADYVELPNVGSPGIFVGGRGVGVLYDARNRTVLASSTWLLVTKDGATAYLASTDQCTWSRWDLLTGRFVGDLERLPSTGCDAAPYLASLTDDGKALIGGAWWDLDTRTIHRAPGGPAVFSSYGKALSPDQNYVAYLLSASPDAHVPASFVTIVDRRTGVQRVATEPLHTLANSSPLSFEESPARVVIYDYSQWAFAVPSLKLIAKNPSTDASAPDDSALLRTTFPKPVKELVPPSEAETAPLRARLAKASCTRGGFIVPRDLCPPP